MTAPARRLADNSLASVAVEFALLAPVLFTLLLGVLQVGIGMQSYNALRGIAADIGRQVAIEYQKSNRLSNEQIRLFGTAAAVQPPYMLDSERVTVSVADASPQRVAGAKELTFTISYVVPSVLGLIDLPEYTVRFSRPIFVEVERCA